MITIVLYVKPDQWQGHKMTKKVIKILNEYQFIINIAINDKLDHLGYKRNISSTRIISINIYSNVTLWLQLKGFLGIILV